MFRYLEPAAITGQKRILCLDMDAFFASVEQASNPKLCGKPVAVTGKSIIVTASYEARKYGVKVGQHYKEGLRHCPALTLVKANNKKYVYVSSHIAEFLQSITPKCTVYSIDEAFLDVTDISASSEEIGYRIKAWIKQRFKITGSVGVGGSYVLAKMATKPRKPDGLYVVQDDQRLEFIDTFKLGDLWGIGRQTVSSLASIGIYTPADVRQFGEEMLHKKWGIRGQIIYNLCCGVDRDVPIPPNNSLYKSMGHSTTTPTNVYKLDIALAYLLQLSEAVSHKARTKGYAGRIVTLYVRNAEWQGFLFRRNLRFYTSATHHIYDAAKSLFLSNVSLQIPLRIIGVSISELIHGSAVLYSLEDMMEGSEDRYIQLYNAMDKINAKYKDGVFRGTSLKIDYRGQNVISPAKVESLFDDSTSFDR